MLPLAITKVSSVVERMEVSVVVTPGSVEASFRYVRWIRRSNLAFGWEIFFHGCSQKKAPSMRRTAMRLKPSKAILVFSEHSRRVAPG